MADSSTAIGAPTSPKTPIKATIAKTKALAKGAAWSIQKSKLQTLQETLRSQVNDLIHLREQRTALKDFRTPTPISKTTISHGTISRSSLIVGAISNGGPLLAIREARAASDRLYQAVTAVTDCQCHRIDLQLSTSVPPENSTADDKLYRLLISPLSNSTPYTCVVVRPERSNPPEGSNPAATAIQSVVQCLPKGGMKKAVSISQSCANKRKGGVRFDLSTILDPGHKKSRPEPDDLKLENAADKSQGSSQQIMTGIVLSLCPYVELRVSSVSVSAMTYFGLLPDVDSYRHVLYRAKKPRSASRISLSEVIKLVNSTSTKKSFAWPIQRRYSLAYMLALSMLCCSGSWFKENWRSEDIILVTEQQEIGDDTIKSPHITAAPRHSRPEPGMSLARSERLFSLAVALIEIGYGESLRNLYFETEVGTYGGLKMQWDCLKEYVGAKKLSTLVSAEMGGRYARVVRKCLECNFGIDEKDLDCLAMQEAFYESVVCELEACVKAFD